MRRFLYFLIISGFVLSMGGCTSVEKQADEETAIAGEGEKGAEEIQLEGEGIGVAETGEAESLDDPSSLLATRAITFEFDSSTIQSDFQDVIAAHASYLVAHPDISIVLEGHADERGTREYNIALGERRAKAVEQLLTLQGVVAKQIQVISFGEERPVALGHDESAWALNRRVEILYSGQ